MLEASLAQTPSGRRLLAPIPGFWPHIGPTSITCISGRCSPLALTKQELELAESAHSCQTRSTGGVELGGHHCEIVRILRHVLEGYRVTPSVDFV